MSSRKNSAPEVGDNIAARFTPYIGGAFDFLYSAQILSFDVANKTIEVSYADGSPSDNLSYKNVWFSSKPPNTFIHKKKNTAGVITPANPNVLSENELPNHGTGRGTQLGWLGVRFLNPSDLLSRFPEFHDPDNSLDLTSLQLQGAPDLANGGGHEMWQIDITEDANGDDVFEYVDIVEEQPVDPVITVESGDSVLAQWPPYVIHDGMTAAEVADIEAKDPSYFEGSITNIDMNPTYDLTDTANDAGQLGAKGQLINPDNDPVIAVNFGDGDVAWVPYTLVVRVRALGYNVGNKDASIGGIRSLDLDVIRNMKNTMNPFRVISERQVMVEGSLVDKLVIDHASKFHMSDGSCNLKVNVAPTVTNVKINCDMKIQPSVAAGERADSGFLTITSDPGAVTVGPSDATHNSEGTAVNGSGNFHSEYKNMANSANVRLFMEKAVEGFAEYLQTYTAAQQKDARDTMEDVLVNIVAAAPVQQQVNSERSAEAVTIINDLKSDVESLFAQTDAALARIKKVDDELWKDLEGNVVDSKSDSDNMAGEIASLNSTTNGLIDDLEGLFYVSQPVDGVGGVNYFEKMKTSLATLVAALSQIEVDMLALRNTQQTNIASLDIDVGDDTGSDVAASVAALNAALVAQEGSVQTKLENADADNTLIANKINNLNVSVAALKARLDRHVTE